MDICYRDYAIYGNFMRNERINLLISTPFSITIDNKLIETTFEDRKNVIDYLKTKEIPINSKIFGIALIRYYNAKKERRLK